MHKVSFILLVIGGLNWLLEAFGWGIGGYLPAIAAQVIYVLIGLAAIYEVATHKGNCRACAGDGAPAAPAQPAPSMGQ